MKVALIGAGNVATHLGVAVKKAGHEIVQVYSRSASSAKTLAHKLKCRSCSDVKLILSSADFYIVSITDHAIKDFLKSFSIKNKVIVHTSGSVGMNVFGKKFTDHGVIYPLQTFSKERKINFHEVPLLIEASSDKSTAAINTVAQSISGFVFPLSSSDRIAVHLSAVIANNFTNHLFIQAEKILKKKNLPFPLLGPLIHETVIKAIRLTPEDAQTGPAKRGDVGIIETHLKMLKDNPSMQQIYKLLSENISRESGMKL